MTDGHILKSDVENLLGNTSTEWELMQKIENLPVADVIEAVRCKECKHNSSKQTAGNATCELFYGMTDQCGYCFRGERKHG